ncbi:MAG: LCP family protein [Mogibacterium sp.]|nr:LCP family protein [Mogibacterium sp.]
MANYNDKDTNPTERTGRAKPSGYRGPQGKSKEPVYDEFESYGINTENKSSDSKGFTEVYDAYLKARNENAQKQSSSSYDDARDLYYHAPAGTSQQQQRPAQQEQRKAPQQSQPAQQRQARPQQSQPAQQRQARPQQSQQPQRQSQADREAQKQQYAQARQQQPAQSAEARPAGNAKVKERDIDLYLAAAREQGRREAESKAAVEKARRERAEAEQKKATRKKSRTVEKRSGGAAEAKKRTRREDVPAAKPAKKKKHPIRFIIVLLLLIVLAAGGYALHMLSKVQKDNINNKDLGIVPIEGYTNILLLGVDSRDMNDTEGARTDAIMIMSINNETDEITLTSIYRDTYLRMGGTDDYDKITHAHSYGGPTMVIRSLNEAFDLNIQDYVLFNFKGVADAIDAIGGIEVEIEEYEIEELNKYTKETAKIIGRDDYNLVTEPGLQTLDGCQAVSYGRIRKGVGDDFKRTERMRTVMKIFLGKVRKMNAFELSELASTVLPECKTSISSSDLMKLALKLKDMKFRGGKGFPYNVTDGYIGDVSYVMSLNLADDVTELHKTVFGQEDYEPSETVLEISAQASYY